jgi:hypothetical protein
VTIDIEGFGSPTRTDPIRAGLRRALDGLSRAAIERVPHADPLSAEGDAGDGKWLLFRSDLPKTSILQEFVPALEVGIRHHNRSASTAATLRLRVGVHHGEITVEDSGYSGEQLNHAFRIIDNDVIRNALKITRNDVVVAVSDDFFQKIIKPGYGALDPDVYAPVMISAKETTTVVWVNSAHDLPAPARVAVQSAKTVVTREAEPQVITLHDLPPETGDFKW